MNVGGVWRAGRLCPEVDAGKTTTSLMRRFRPSSVTFIQFTNFAACAGYLEFDVTASASPPQMPTCLSPAVQAGSAAASHLPAVSFAMDGNWLGPHPAPTHPTSAPLFMSVFHCADQFG